MARPFWILAISTLAVLLPSATPTPLPDRVYVHNSTAPTQNKTIADLVQRQTDTIKKIVSNHQSDYPLFNKFPANHKQKVDDPVSLDELRVKCQNLARLTSTTTSTPSAQQTGFYVTTDATPVTTPKPSPAPVKYIKLEPVILQKTIMGDGRTIYYWHKSIPSQVVSAPSSTPPTTTTTAAPSGYGFRNFFPSFYSSGAAEPPLQTTTEKAPAAERPEELHLYQQQLKFVVPVPYVPPDDSGLRKPWELDQYAYYPKPLQPDTVNMQMPYVPTFHVIKALAIPNQFESGATNE